MSIAAYLLVSRSRRLPAGATLEIRDSSGAVLLSHRAADSFPMSAFASPAFAIGETYAPRIDGARAGSIRLGGVVTNARRLTAGACNARLARPKLEAYASKYRESAPNSATQSSGLPRCASAPADRQRSTSSLNTFAVMAMMGTCAA